MNKMATENHNGILAETSTAKPAEVPGNAWGERISALKNVPPVLKILWESGPAVVAWGIILRLIVAGLPALIGYVSAWILGNVKLAIDHQPLPPRFWWMVGAEVALAVIAGRTWQIPEVASGCCDDSIEPARDSVR